MACITPAWSSGKLGLNIELSGDCHWVIPENIHTIPWVASWNSEGKVGDFLDWNSEGIVGWRGGGGRGLMQLGIPNAGGFQL